MDKLKSIFLSLLILVSVVFSVNISSCQNITASGNYTLINNLSSTDTCINIIASNVILDCAGYSITGMNTSYGINILNSSSQIKNCRVYNYSTGIYIQSSSNNAITNNTANSNNGHGIVLVSSSSNNTLTNNMVENNSQYQIYIIGTNNNLIYNNIFNATGTQGLAYADSVIDNWNTTKTGGTNIIGGPYLGGNFWAKADGTGPSQTCSDTDRDGICDSSYS
ncbi:MAG: NosD domain-containing protein, partial [Candidatus Micrarchaeota archaeon]